MTTAIEIVLFSLLGLTVGSFLNVCSDRLPLGKSIISPPSHCDACQRRLTVRDLVPLFSYLWLHGRCRYCGARISPRFAIVELATGLLFALLCWKYGLSPELVMALIYGCLFLTIFVIDLEHGLVLDIIVYPAIALALVFSFFWFEPDMAFWPDSGPLTALLGGATGFSLLLIPYLIYQEGMGGGDVKLAALIGLSTGFPHVFTSLLLAFLAGGLVAILLLLLRLRSRKEAIPFAPFLAAAAMVTIVWGETIYDWWVGLV